MLSLRVEVIIFQIFENRQKKTNSKNLKKLFWRLSNGIKPIFFQLFLTPQIFSACSASTNTKFSHNKLQKHEQNKK